MRLGPEEDEGPSEDAPLEDAAVPEEAVDLCDVPVDLCDVPDLVDVLEPEPETVDLTAEPEIDAVDPDELAELAAVLLPPERLAASGVGPNEDTFRAAVGRASTALTESAAA